MFCLVKLAQPYSATISCCGYNYNYDVETRKAMFYSMIKRNQDIYVVTQNFDEALNKVQDKLSTLKHHFILGKIVQS